jgi:SAM-dependent methyltransferase
MQIMAGKNYGTEYWDQVAKKMAKGQDFDLLLAEQYRRVHLDLLDKWVNVSASQKILKTDLFAEALCPSRAFLWDILKTESNLVGIDISAEIVCQARARATQYAPNSSAEYVRCDVRQLPFISNSFDLIISDSSLDHFRRKDSIITALFELSRVLKLGGTLIITMDNKNNPTESLFRLWISLGLAPFFSGETYSVRELEQVLARVGLHVVDDTAIIHNPRFFTRSLIGCLRKVAPTRFDHWIRRSLVFLDSLENRKTKHLTAQFIAVKAMKP